MYHPIQISPLLETGSVSNNNPNFELVEFTTTVSAEMLQAAESVLAGASILQNLALKDWIEQATHLKRKHAFLIVQFSSFIVAVLGILLGFLSPAEKHRIWMIIGSAFLLLFLFCFLVGHDQVDGYLQRFVERMFRRKARKSIARTALQAPFDVVYKIDEYSYQARVEKVKLNRNIDCKNVSAAYFSANTYCLFKKKTSQNWCGIVYTSSDEQRRAFDQLFERSGVEVRGIEAVAAS